MILNPAYKSRDGSNIYSGRESSLYQQLDILDNTVQNISYQVPYKGATKPATQTDSELYQQIEARNSTHYNVLARNDIRGCQAPQPATFDSVELSEQPHGDNRSKQMKAKITVAATVLIAALTALTIVLALLAIIIVAVLYTSTSNYNQVIQILEIDIGNLTAQLGRNETQGKRLKILLLF